MNFLQTLLDDSVLIDFEKDLMLEGLQGGKVNVFKVTPKDISDLKDDVFAIKNENAVVDFLVDLLGIPRDGTAYKIRTGFMAYDEKTKTMFFSKNKYDLPAFLGKRPVK